MSSLISNGAPRWLHERVVGISLFRLRLPLSRPYHLAYGDLTAFDTVLVHAETSGGAEGWGETTPLRGYSHEDADGVWPSVVEWSRTLHGRSVEEALSFLDARSSGFPFACAGLATALESLTHPGAVDNGRPGTKIEEPGTAHSASAADSPDNAELRLPLVGTIQSVTAGGVAEDVDRLLQAGYTCLKLKVGNDLAADLANVHAAQRALGTRGRLRIDANQGYALNEAQELLQRLDPAIVQLLEQPFPAARWDWMERVGSTTNVPLMLDESIADANDLERARGLPGVRYVKFKLMKAGGISRLKKLIDHAHSIGFEVVVGNGVAGDIGCLQEMWGAADRVHLASETNGFLKPVESLLVEPLRVVRGEVVAPPLGHASIVPERLDRYRIDAVTV